jgi:hypothetical protein
MPSKTAGVGNMPSTTADVNVQKKNDFEIQTGEAAKSLPSDKQNSPSRYNSIQQLADISEINKHSSSLKSSDKKALKSILEELLSDKKGSLLVPKLNLDKLPVGKVESKNTKSTKETKTIRNLDSAKKEQEKVIINGHRKYNKLRDVQQDNKTKLQNPYLKKQAKQVFNVKKLIKNRRQLIEGTPYNKIKESNQELRERLRIRYGNQLTIEAKNKIKKDLVAGIQKIVDKKKLESPEMKIRQVKNIIKSNQNGIQRDTVSSYIRKSQDIQTKVEKGKEII